MIFEKLLHLEDNCYKKNCPKLDRGLAEWLVDIVADKS